jgi:perosamine synthetase
VSWFVYVIRINHRDAVMRGLAEAGIASGRYFAPIHLQPSYSAFSHAHLPVTVAESSRTLALPFFSQLGPDQLDEVCDTLSRLL